MQRKGPSWRTRRMMVLAILAVALFSYPLLAIVDGIARAHGHWWLPVYMFAAWALIILLIGWTMSRRQDRA